MKSCTSALRYFLCLCWCQVVVNPRSFLETMKKLVKYKQKFKIFPSPPKSPMFCVGLKQCQSNKKVYSLLYETTPSTQQAASAKYSQECSLQLSSCLTLSHGKKVKASIFMVIKIVSPTWLAQLVINRDFPTKMALFQSKSLANDLISLKLKLAQ